jgi:predicted lactoylglutathione lyase
MIGYVCLGTNDLARAARFYDELLGTLGAKRIWETDRFVAWGTAPTGSLLLLIKPYDGMKATVGNGTMVALSAGSSSAVDAVYQKALALGGTDEGPAGARGDGFYAGYFRDLEGNKLAVFHMG